MSWARSAESLALQTRLSAGAGHASHVHVGEGERPLVGELGDPFVSRPVRMRRLRLDSDQHGLVTALRRLQGRAEFERMRWVINTGTWVPSFDAVNTRSVT